MFPPSVNIVVPFLIQAWLFLTPVAYPTDSVPQNLRWLTGLNPMTWVIDFSRWALAGTGSKNSPATPSGITANLSSIGPFASFSTADAVDCDTQIMADALRSAASQSRGTG